MLKENLRALRMNKGKTQRQMAKILNVSQNAYCKYELGATEPNIDTLKILANYFGVSLDFLAYGNIINVCLNVSLGEKIKVLRESRGLTQRNLALRLEISNATISRIEKNIVIPDLNTINKIANFFNVKTDYLIGKENDLKTCKRGVKVPVLGTIPAGIPIEAIEDILDFEEITEEMASKGDYFALKVKGNSMMPTILDGDVVIVKRQEDAESGKVCVVVVNGFDATLKEIKKDEQGIWVLPHNPTSEFKAKFYTNEEIEKLPVKILGVAVEIRRPL